MPNQDNLDLIGNIVAYEEDLLSDEEIRQLFQTLVNSGMAWQLQGSYGRMASRLLADGLITLPVDRAQLRADIHDGPGDLNSSDDALISDILADEDEDAEIRHIGPHAPDGHVHHAYPFQVAQEVAQAYCAPGPSYCEWCGVETRNGADLCNACIDSQHACANPADCNRAGQRYDGSDQS